LSGCDKTSVVACMIVATLFYGSMFTGVFANHVDIAPNFAGKYKKTIQGVNFTNIQAQLFLRKQCKDLANGTQIWQIFKRF
jgi:hypothetical protein